MNAGSFCGKDGENIEMIEIIPSIQELDTYVRLSEEYTLGFEYNDFFDPELLDDSTALEERIRLYRSLGRPAGRDTMHGAFFDLVPFSRDEGIRAYSIRRMRQSVEIAGRLGCRAVVFHSGLEPRFMTGTGYYNGWLDQMTDVMKMLLAQEPDLDIYCENVLERSPGTLLDLAERLKGERRFGICVDVAHLTLAKGDAAEWFDALGPYIRHFHLNDNHLQTDDHLALGKGDIDWKNVFGLMRRKGLWDVSRLLEVKGLEKVRESLEYLKEMS